MELFQPLRNIYNQVRLFPRASVTSGGLAWMSRYIYRYSRLMLHNLGQRQPAVRHWPCFGQPPPHFLVGYQTIVRICNDYIFDSRAFSRIQYIEARHRLFQGMNWSVLANCSYTVNTGAYHRFLDVDNIEESLRQMQQAILADRVVADLALITPLRGFGSTRFADAPGNVPVEAYLSEQYKDLGQCQEAVWGMADRARIQTMGKKDVLILATIRRLKTAYFNYLMSGQEEVKLSLPCNCYWIDAFLEKFTTLSEESTRPWMDQPIEKITKAMIAALTLPTELPQDNWPGFCREFSGGAFELRPRENGRAVTEEMRRRRGEMVTRFIESLPLPRRRRRRPPPASPPPPPVPEEEMPEEEEAPVSFEEEVRAAIAEVIRALEEELTVTARQHQFFNFAPHFYETMQHIQLMGNVTETVLRRWVMYFFTAEHIATTLNYLNHALHRRVLSRHVELNLAQVIMRARTQDGHIAYSRVWNQQGDQAFVRLMQRISVDLAATVERAGQGELEEEEVEQFMADIAYQDNSGDVTEILRQAAMNDMDIDSIEISFRFKVTGPVVYSQNSRILDIHRRVLNYASLLRQTGQNLPDMNQVVDLPRP